MAGGCSFASPFEALDGCYISAQKCDIAAIGAYQFVHDLCNEPELLSSLANKLRTSDYAPQLAVTAQVVIRKLREREGQGYLTTALAGARSADINLVSSVAAAMCGINHESVRNEDFQILDELAKHNDRHVRETV